MSFSRWKKWNDCGEAYRRRYIDKQYGAPSVYMVAGTAFHSWTDAHDQGADLDMQHWVDLFDAELEAREEKTGIPLRDWDNPMGRVDMNLPQATKLRNELGPSWCDMYHQWRVTTGWEVATGLPPDDNGNRTGIEYEVTLTVGTVELIVILDRIFRLPTGELEIVDTKSWSKRRTEPQLPTYLVGARRRGVPVARASYYEARKGTTTKPVDYQYWSDWHLRAMYEQTAHAITAGFFPPRPNEDCETFCSQRHGCPFRIKTPQGEK